MPDSDPDPLSLHIVDIFAFISYFIYLGLKLDILMDTMYKAVLTSTRVESRDL